MEGIRSYILWVPTLGALALVLLLGACDGGGPSVAPTSTDAVMLATETPASTEDPFQHELSTTCPYLREVCIVLDDSANIYQAFSLERVTAFWVQNPAGERRWIRDTEVVQELLRPFDGETSLERMTLTPSLRVVVVWPPGEGLQQRDGSVDDMGFALDEEAGLIGTYHLGPGFQWAVPANFSERLLAEIADVTPTPWPHDQ